MDTPAGPEQRYDITRPLRHHMYILGNVPRLKILGMKQEMETVVFALVNATT